MIGAVAGIGELRTRFDLPRPEIDHVLYGTTIVTNAVPEHGAAVTGTVWRSVGRAGVQRPPANSLRGEEHGGVPRLLQRLLVSFQPRLILRRDQLAGACAAADVRIVDEGRDCPVVAQ